MKTEILLISKDNKQGNASKFKLCNDCSSSIKLNINNKGIK